MTWEATWKTRHIVCKWTASVARRHKLAPQQMSNYHHATMSEPTTYTATSWRDGSSWLVQISELDRTARVARLSQVEAVARELVATATRGDEATARVVVEMRVSSSVSELLQAAAAVRNDADRVSVETVTLRRGLARRLAAEGFAVRDIATLLRVSYGRAHQLIAGGGGTSTSRRERPRQVAERKGTGTARVPAPRLPAKEAHVGYQHEAFIYRGDDDFLSGLVPFVHDGVARGQPVMVAVREPRLGLLRDALEADADDVVFVDMMELGANPARIIPAWQHFVDDKAGPGQPVRGIGEPVWAGRRPAEIVECQLHEALLNLAVESDAPLWLRCPYDASALDAAVLGEAARSHPALVDGESHQLSRSYGGADHVVNMFGAGLPEPRTDDVSSYKFTDVSQVRTIVTRHAAEADIDSGRAQDLAVAMTEVATNSVRHGGGQGTLRTWRELDSLVCEVADQGQICDPLVGRRMPSLTAEGGRGVWLVNQLADLVQLRSTPEGTTVRLRTWL